VDSARCSLPEANECCRMVLTHRFALCVDELKEVRKALKTVEAASGEVCLIAR
jgi:hypothetical protein